MEDLHYHNIGDIVALKNLWGDSEPFAYEILLQVEKSYGCAGCYFWAVNDGGSYYCRKPKIVEDCAAEFRPDQTNVRFRFHTSHLI